MAVVCVLNFLELGFLCQGTRPLKHIYAAIEGSCVGKNKPERLKRGEQTDSTG